MDPTFESAKRLVPFAFSRSGLGPIGRKVVADMLDVARQASHVYVRGRSDNTGSKEMNRQLALNRAFSASCIALNASLLQMIPQRAGRRIAAST